MDKPIDYLPASYLSNEIIKYYPNQYMLVGCNNAKYNSLFTRTNNAGFRGKEFAADKINIGIFGDSYVFGYCLKDNETIDFRLQDKFDNYSKKYNIVNYGVLGFNLLSSLINLEEVIKNKTLEYAIVYFLPLDDMRKMDSSARLKLKIYEPYKSREFEKNKDKYIKEGKDTGLGELENIIQTRIINKSLHKKTKIIFFIYCCSPEAEKILQRNNLTYISMVKPNHFDYVIPMDGHPSAKFNQDQSKIFFEYIIELEKKKSLK